ncbi:MAG: hypothetical protein CM15mP12_6240 [Gammaproteobacteria bacterium]|nr:MAG: hypothetical protein CM15mP12_6240 [Gammaproteobacteria bacterium]
MIWVPSVITPILKLRGGKLKSNFKENIEYKKVTFLLQQVEELSHLVIGWPVKVLANKETDEVVVFKFW